MTRYSIAAAPIYTGEGVPLTRVGVQMTYVFYKDGVETFVIKPGFEGKVDEYLSIVMRLIFAFGVSFLMPVGLVLLGKVGIIDWRFGP